MDRRKFIAATCSTVGMSAIGMPALAQAKTKIRVGYLHTLAVDGQIWWPRATWIANPSSQWTEGLHKTIGAYFGAMSCGNAKRRCCVVRRPAVLEWI
jgi:hypothetical protein